MKLGLLCVLGMLLLLGPGVSVVQADPDDAPGKICNDNANFGFDHDTCVVCVKHEEEEEGAGRVCFCQILLDVGEISQNEFGACVSGRLGPDAVSLATLSTLLAGWAVIQVRRRRNRSQC